MVRNWELEQSGKSHMQLIRHEFSVWKAPNRQGERNDEDSMVFIALGLRVALTRLFQTAFVRACVLLHPEYPRVVVVVAVVVGVPVGVGGSTSTKLRLDTLRLSPNVPPY